MAITAGRSPREETPEVSYFALHQPRSSRAAKVLRAKYKVNYQMSQHLRPSMLTTCLPQVTSELSSKETILGNGALWQNGATFACFRVGKTSPAFQSFCNLKNLQLYSWFCIADTSWNKLPVGTNTDSVILCFFPLYKNETHKFHNTFKALQWTSQSVHPAWLVKQNFALLSIRLCPIDNFLLQYLCRMHLI